MSALGQKQTKHPAPKSDFVVQKRTKWCVAANDAKCQKLPFSVLVVQMTFTFDRDSFPVTNGGTCNAFMIVERFKDKDMLPASTAFA